MVIWVYLLGDNKCNDSGGVRISAFASSKTQFSYLHTWRYFLWCVWGFCLFLGLWPSLRRCRGFFLFCSRFCRLLGCSLSRVWVWGFVGVFVWLGCLCWCGLGWSCLIFYRHWDYILFWEVSCFFPILLCRYKWYVDYIWSLIIGFLIYFDILKAILTT